MDEEPLVSVVRGTPTDRELAALVAVIAARSTSMDTVSPRPPVSAWMMSARPSMGPSSWRHSGLPR
ncbi:acyl-CoA carboxylase subunit epsilon [Actinoplanes sp. KI2]|uniref:acyl-CoA carboxylase epsilon subunit n=1 Tax=Actinoplanes sp. KI2 TaxID=2983315 RepID=UPI0021D59436|nr:acyl-CoA carboxylase epsilon subunit [Actinoplanes sp. KI2]MCU7726702.1 acyl-CoA carboxylase subunit epsilon [Actinoplanes sp. KI2]